MKHTLGLMPVVWLAQDPAAKKPEDWDDRAMIDDPEDKKVRSPAMSLRNPPACFHLKRGQVCACCVLHPVPQKQSSSFLWYQPGSFRKKQGMLHACFACRRKGAHIEGADQGHAHAQPEGYDDIPQFITDAEAKRPEDWDEEEDGVWEAPQVPNPEFKGRFVAKQISNPAYKGSWQARPGWSNLGYVQG